MVKRGSRLRRDRNGAILTWFIILDNLEKQIKVNLITALFLPRLSGPDVRRDLRLTFLKNKTMYQTTNGIFYKTYGENHGYALVFLHGYLESSEIWNHFATLFADEYFVVCIDIPGHGKSAVLSENAGMEQWADAIIKVCDHIGIPAFYLTGHSMGGYLSLAILEKYPDKLNSVVLLHSHCLSDSEEKKANRDREIGLIKDGKKELIINTSIPNLYATENLEAFAEQVEISKSIALQTTEEGIISALNAMKSRPDRSNVLSQTDVPVLLVGGRKDNLIPFEMMEKMKALSPSIKLIPLEKSGHMGFIEQSEYAAMEMKKFFDENFECM